MFQNHTLVSEAGGTKKFEAKCRLCCGGSRLHRYYGANPSNLKKHLKTVRVTVSNVDLISLLWIICYLKVHQNEYERICEQTKMKETLDPISDAKKTDIAHAIVKFIVKERLPLVKVTSKYFNNLIRSEFFNNQVFDQIWASPTLTPN